MADPPRPGFDRGGSVVPHAVPPHGREVAWAFVLALVFGVAAALVGVMAFLLVRATGEPVEVSHVLLFAFLGEGSCVLLGCWVALRRRRPARLAVLGFIPLTRGQLAGAVQTGLLCVLGGAVAIAVIRLALGGSGGRGEGIAELLPAMGVLRFGLVLWAGAYLVPLAEEMLFRGLLFAWLRGRLAFPAAAAASAASFAVAHVMNGVPNAVFAFLLGLVLARSYEQTRSLWAPIAIHRTVNAAGLTLLWLAT